MADSLESTYESPLVHRAALHLRSLAGQLEIKQEELDRLINSQLGRHRVSERIYTTAEARELAAWYMGYGPDEEPPIVRNFSLPAMLISLADQLEKERKEVAMLNAVVLGQAIRQNPIMAEQ